MPNYRHITPVPLWVMNLTAFCMIISATLFLTDNVASNHRQSILATNSLASRELPELGVFGTNPFNGLLLEAKASIVYDVNRNRIIFGQNENAQLPLASITKLMTALVASETLPPYTMIPIVPLTEEYDPRLIVGESWPLETLISYTLLTSSNSGADSIATAVAAYLDGTGTRNERLSSKSFVAAMNARAETLGMKQTYFINGSGLDLFTSTGGAYGSARDVALLLAHLLEQRPGLLSATVNESMSFTGPDGRIIEAKNTNTGVSGIPGIRASKTGFTDLAGGNLAIAFDVSFGEPYIIVVMNSTQEGRFLDTEILTQATIDYLGSHLWGYANVYQSTR